jgi:hypothetical protein
MRHFRSAFVLCAAMAVLVACDFGKKDAADAAAAALAPPPTTAAPTATPGSTDPGPVNTVAALGSTTAAPVQPGQPGHPVATPDGGARPDAGKTTPAGDGGTAPAPTPTFTVPTIPGFDAGGFKPPPGFPTALPTFPPPPQK